jgi:hypothetical protein
MYAGRPYTTLARRCTPPDRFELIPTMLGELVPL